MIGHQAPSPNGDPRRAAVFGEQREIKAIVRFAKEGLCPAIAALGHMVRDVGKNNTGKAGHRLWICQEQRVVNGGSLSVSVRKFVHCHRSSVDMTGIARGKCGPLVSFGQEISALSP
jgi:hypothetical protein